jgi:hypothetical protein
VLSLSSLIQFLLDLLRDPDAADEFARDPQGVLAANGLAGVTAQDVRDVVPLLADQPGVGLCRPPDGDHDGDHGADRHGGHHVARHHEPVHHRHDDDPVREIHHVRTQYVVERHEVHHTPQHTVHHHQHHEFTYVDNSIDNSIHAGDGATVVVDSFNQDNDGVDNKGGTIDDSVVAGRDAGGSGNTTEQTVVQDSFDVETTSTVTDSGNTTTAVEVTDSGNDASTDVTGSFNTDAGTAVQDSFAGATVNDSYAVQAPQAAAPAADQAPAGADALV